VRRRMIYHLTLHKHLLNEINRVKGRGETSPEERNILQENKINWMEINPKDVS
jgi:hypothetical protein